MKLPLFLIAFSFGLLAQDQARIVGVVSDPTGAAISRASITATDERTGSKRQATADDRGFYIITNLSPSNYSVVASGQNLGPTEFKEVTLTVGQERTLNITLQPASVNTQVNVESGALTEVETS